ncbi:MAG: N-acetylglucosamine-6-phosphate deacetylase [Lachnospiraceae bacterium]|nr:N-acetylglucosamine-6-phosphate deacetylase [Lachnospiraceae bacterium]
MIIKGAKVFDTEEGFKAGDIQYVDGVITAVEEKIETGEEVIDATGLLAIPGLTDIHFHGCVGYDFCDGTTEAIAHMAAYELANGVTTICPASMTFSEEQLAAIFACAANYRKSDAAAKGAALVGINMEGPFISYEKKGAQNPTYIHKPDANMFLRLQEKAEGLIKLLDIAPEVDGAMECIEKVADKVRVSVAHTTADYEIAMKAFMNGAREVTHLYNAMLPFSHRAPGVIGAALDREDVTVELITDGIHCHPSTVRATFKMFGDRRIIMISDSMMATGMKDGQYSLGGQAVTVVGHTATLTEGGNIAGSATNLMDCIRVAVQKMGIPLESAVRCATINPAKAIGIDKQYGSLEAGKAADIVLLDENLNIHTIIKAGKVVTA